MDMRTLCVRTPVTSCGCWQTLPLHLGLANGKYDTMSKPKSAPPTPTAIHQKTGLSKAYASQILNGERTPTLKTALLIFRETGHQVPPIVGAGPRDIAALERFGG